MYNGQVLSKRNNKLVMQCRPTGINYDKKYGYTDTIL